MPANKKYLLQTRLGRTSKILAIFFGGLFATLSVHLSLAIWVGYAQVISGSVFTVFLLWVFFMVMVYWLEKPWKSWLFLLVIILLSVLGIVLGQS